MDQPYSIVADWLSKFHTWPEPIQALWLIMIPLTVLGMTWIVMRGLAGLVRPLARRKRGRLLDGIDETAHGLSMIGRRDRAPYRIGRDSPPPEPTGPGGLVRGPWHEPDA